MLGYRRLYIRNKTSRLCISPTFTPSQNTCVFNPANQQWRIVPMYTDPFSLRDYFRIVSTTTGTCLRATSSGAHGASLASGSCSGTHAEWAVRDGIPLDLYGFTEQMQTIAPSQTPTSHFWSSTFSFVKEGAPAEVIGGYMGLQRDAAGFSRAAAFAIWGGSVGASVASGGRCQGWDDSIGTPTTEGGYGMSCVVPYSWSDGGSYLFQLSFAGYGSGPQTHHTNESLPGKWWRATVNGMQIARIFVAGRHRTGAGVHLLASRSSSFSEQFANYPDACTAAGSLNARYDPPYVWNDGGRASQDSDPTHRVGPDQRCPNQVVDWIWDSAKNSWGSIRFHN